jgi:hypothetical protein
VTTNDLGWYYLGLAASTNNPRSIIVHGIDPCDVNRELMIFSLLVRSNLVLGHRANGAYIFGGGKI